MVAWILLFANAYGLHLGCFDWRLLRIWDRLIALDRPPSRTQDKFHNRSAQQLSSSHRMGKVGAFLSLASLFIPITELPPPTTLGFFVLLLFRQHQSRGQQQFHAPTNVLPEDVEKRLHCLRVQAGGNNCGTQRASSRSSITTRNSPITR
jgi:hypothetical protein